MVVRIIIAGESQCQIFAQICLVADYLSQHMSNLYYERIEKSVLEWKAWLCRINQQNKWHHAGSPIIWKEILMNGSKPYYIGGASEFLEYCHSYYDFDLFFASEKFEGLVQNFAQYQNKVKEECYILNKRKAKFEILEGPILINFVITVFGIRNPLSMYLISGLLEMKGTGKNISKIYIYDSNCSKEFMESMERECNYIETDNTAKVVKYVEKIGMALTNTDLLIILDHVPFDPKQAIGKWLMLNKKNMKKIALMINASAKRKMCVLFPNLGPACYNASILIDATNINKNNIVVATSDLGLEVAPFISEITEVPMRSVFCSPVWGFVGINHLVDICTTIHKYNSFEPYNRFRKVKNSTLNIGSVTPEFRTLEYLLYFNETFWMNVAEKKAKQIKNQVSINKALAVLDVVKCWLFEPSSNQILNLGIRCNGSFGLTFKGAFSQPARLVEGEWTPANEFLLPRDPQMKLAYLEYMAYFTMTLKQNDLPPITPYYPCTCKRKFYKKKEVGNTADKHNY